MKVTTQPQPNIIKLPETEFALLDSIFGQNYRYIITYMVNAGQALKFNCSTVKITIVDKIEKNVPPNVLSSTSEFSGVAGIDSKMVVRNLLNRNSTIKDVIQANKSQGLFSIISDFTAWISNDKTSEINSKIASGKQNIKIKRERTFQTVQLSDITAGNMTPAILETPLIINKKQLSAIGKGIFPNKIELKKTSLDLISKHNIEPASLIIKQNAISHSKASHGGILQKVNRPKSYNESINIVQPMIDGLNFAGQLNKPDQNKLNGASFVSQPNVSVSEFINVSEYLDIPLNLLGNKEFFLNFELKNANGETIQALIQQVDHSKFISAFEMPKIAPTITTKQTNEIGKNILYIKQNDPNAIGVKIYKKQLTKTNNSKNTNFTFVNSLTLTTVDGVKKIIDKTSNLNPVIYRAIPYGKNGTLSAEFGSTVTTAVKNFGLKTKIHEQEKFLSLKCEITGQGIQITISNIPSGVISLELRKKIVRSTITDSIVVAPIQISHGTSSYFVIDSNVKANVVYEYYCKLTYKYGSTEISSTRMPVHYIPITKSIVTTKILNTKAIQSNSKLDVTFELESALIHTDEGELKKALELQGLSTLFQNDLIKENLQNLIAYKIQRTNVTLGVKEEFGIILDTKFSDSTLGNIKNVTPIKSGCEYMYTVETYLRAPETMLKNYTTTITDEKNPNRTYSYKPWNWQHPITLNEGNIITEQSLKKNHAQEQFTFGEIGSRISTIISLTDTIPIIFDAKTTKINNKLIRVQWKINGNLSLIDHFIVVMDVLGMRTVVGKSHNISNSNYFEFIDSLDNNETGELSYVILPVFYDYTRGTEIVTNKVLI